MCRMQPRAGGNLQHPALQSKPLQHRKDWPGVAAGRRHLSTPVGQNICPGIPADKYVSFEGSGDAAVALQPGRDLLAAHPDAKRMAVVGINDGGVLGLINAAEQLGRADEVIGWGQDGAFITGDNVNPHLVGSVFYFLEGYAVYAVRDVIKPVADGNTPPLKADAGDPASKVQPCPVTAEQAKGVPDMPERVAQLLAAPAGTTAYDLFCPNKG